MRTPIELITDLSKLRLGVVTPDMGKCAQILGEELTFQAKSFPSGTEANGWIVPQSWHVEKATIHNAAGELIYDGLSHLIGVCVYSQSFIAGIGGEELKRHLFFTDKYDDALIFHCDFLYKPHRPDWGFSVTKKFYDSIGDREAYHVELRTVHAPGVMETLVATSFAPRSGAAQFVLNAHSCHPSLCNDDLSGIAVGVEVMKRLPKLHRHEYHLVIAPEHYGTIFLLDDVMSPLRMAKGGIFLEAFGTDGDFAFQRSFTGHSLMDRAIRNVLATDHDGHWYERRFREIAGNDETCWEAPGIEVPFASLTRYPFKEYHTSNDNVALMDPAQLEQAVQAVLAVIDILERDCTATRLWRDGLVCLSNPKYDLYMNCWDPSIESRNSPEKIGADALKLNALMNCMPRYLDGKTTCLQIAEKFGLPFRAVRDYLSKWEAKGLIKTEPAPINNGKPLELPPW